MSKADGVKLTNDNDYALQVASLMLTARQASTPPNSRRGHRNGTGRRQSFRKQSRSIKSKSAFCFKKRHGNGVV
ncbi:hypothetical protein ACSE3M_09665 [Bacillus velezensis]